MTEREKQIEEIKDVIDSVYGCDCAYFGVDGLAIAAALYNADYRKQIEGEWIESVEHKTNLLKSCMRKEKTYCCPYCGRVYRKRMNYCGHCGAKMKGGESDA